MMLHGRPLIRWSSACNVVWDGNSLVEGVGSSGGQTIDVQTHALAPLAGSGATRTNVGISAQSWADMTANAADVNAAWQTGKVNILVPWESTNAVFNEGKTSTQVISDCQSYLSALTAVHPWSYILVTSLPRRGSTAQCNELIAVDNYMRANWRAMGAAALVDVRAAAPFNFVGDADAPFVATQSYWYETSSWVHLTNAGYAVVAALIAEALRRLPYRVSRVWG